MLQKSAKDKIRSGPDRVRRNIDRVRTNLTKSVTYGIGEVININTQSSFNVVYVGRGSKYGNPYRIGEDGDRDECIEKYRIRLLCRPDLVEMIRKELNGRVLGCFCAPNHCHAHVIAWVAAGYDPEDFSF